MRKVAYAACLLSAAVLMSCSQEGEFKKTDLGFDYKMINHDENATPITSDKVVMYHADYMLGDKVLISTREINHGEPFFLMYNEAMDQDSVPMLMAIKMCNLGDSGIFRFNAKDLYTNSFNMPLPDSITEESNILAHIKISDIYSQEEYQVFLQNQENEIFQDQLVEIDEYLESQGAEVKTTDSGIRYVILSEGTGNSPMPGDSVTVHYTGTLFDGTKFDSSVDRDKPFTFTIGIGQVIQGWDEGIAMLNKNAKAKLYIPSKLGYGSRGAGGAIPPNSILVFEVELLDY